MDQELHDLAEGYISDTLDDSQLAHLEQRLAASEEDRLAFLSYLEIHSSLAWESRGSQESVIPFPTAVRSRFRAWALPVAALVTLLAVLSFLFLRSAPSPTGIATVRANLHGLWADGSPVRMEAVLTAGIWELQSGLVELETSTGTTLLLEGPASIRLNDKLHARLISGNLVVRMPKGRSGFVVDLPKMKITDLGTEFGVSVSSDGESRVQVYDGKVRAESKESPRKELAAGETVSCSTDGRMAFAEFQEDRFIRTFPPVAPNYQEGGPLYNRSTLHEVDAAAAPPSVTIDGSLMEWDRSVAFLSACQPPYDKTYFVNGMMMHDKRNLYLSAEVGDPIPMRNTSRAGAEFAGGSVIVRICADRAMGWPLEGTQADARSPEPSPDSTSGKISSIVMWYDAKSGQPQIQILSGFGSAGRQINPPGWEGVFRKHPDGHGYTLEYRIPWTLLNCGEDPPQAGDQLAGLWMAHWSDEAGRVCRGQLVDVTNPDPAAIDGIPPYIFFQNGPCWGKVNYLPIRR
ncbi:FecR domain-containing protein [Luteolibacter sp. SL250]|uniref:FecR domain-containing protein n=1 Tax=Luteolibacter sp. SL250 TaxID=2995170 RepID=UPI00226F13A7|nr:FecR domain-containing protein [Luteolibacter sp. SL250]WAC19506.1 FecR domain-containing protein [Luteolibacter sp. SL250]